VKALGEYMMLVAAAAAGIAAVCGLGGANRPAAVIYFKA